MSFPIRTTRGIPPESEVGRNRLARRAVARGLPETAAERERILDDKPRHWRLWYDGELVSNYEAPAAWVPANG